VGKFWWLMVLQERENRLFSFFDLRQRLGDEKVTPIFLGFDDVLKRILNKRSVTDRNEKMKRRIDKKGAQKKSGKKNFFFSA